MPESFYDVLGVPKSVSQEDLKKAYRALMLECHPDKNTSEAAQEKAKRVNAAYSVLSDPQKRKEYDFGPSRQFRQPSPEDFFRGFPGGFGFGFSSSGPRRGADIKLQLRVNLFEAVAGASKEVSYSFEAPCTSCVKKCQPCEGRGVFINRSGNMVSTVACTACGGRGEDRSGCDKCGSTGVVKITRDVIINVPPATGTGAKLGIAGAGRPGTKGGPSGNLVAFIELVLPKKASLTAEQLSQIEAICSGV